MTTFYKSRQLNHMFIKSHWRPYISIVTGHHRTLKNPYFFLNSFIPISYNTFHEMWATLWEMFNKNRIHGLGQVKEISQNVNVSYCSVYTHPQVWQDETLAVGWKPVGWNPGLNSSHFSSQGVKKK